MQPIHKHQTLKYIRKPQESIKYYKRQFPCQRI